MQNEELLNYNQLLKSPPTSKYPPEPFIRGITSTGLVKIEWDQKIFFTRNLKFLIEAGAITFSINSNYAGIGGT